MAKFYVTTPIYYINDKPHIGHAYTTIAADVLARYYRQKGDQVWFSTGTDENSIKTVKAAEAAGKEIGAYTNAMAEVWQQTWDKLNIKYDRFIRTTEDAHRQTVKAILAKVEGAGDVYKGSYKGLYCEGCEEFKREADLVDGLCPLHKVAPKAVEEENYFFKLSKYAKPLLEHITKHPEFVLPETRRHEVVEFIKQGLEDISITRQHQQWGIAYPSDESQVIYVWVEALMNYVSVTGYPAKGYEQWWPADAHLVGKDIIKFHCIYWPALLLSAGLELPKSVVANGFLQVEGTKISKSLGNAVNPLELADKYGVDALRYVLLKDTPYGQDGEFSLKRFGAVYNADLANELGNLVQRTAAMVKQYQNGVIGETGDDTHDVEPYHEAMRNFRFDKALDEVGLLIKGLNQYVDEEKPWQLAKEKDGEEHLGEVLSYLVSNILGVAKLLVPFMPQTAEKIEQTFAGGLVHPEIGILFPKFEDQKVADESA